ncbi:MAG: hypothetical protein ACRD0Z_11165 [Acidimicrobiales bacterium]
MAALLMPKTIFVKIARHEVIDQRAAAVDAATRRLAAQFAESCDAFVGQHAQGNGGEMPALASMIMVMKLSGS